MATPNLTFDTTSKRPTNEPEILIIGVDFRCAPLELREKVAYNAEEAETLMLELVSTREIAEACVLSTCNRTELYLRANPSPIGPNSRAYRIGFERAFLSRAPEIEEEGRFYVKRDREAARHLLEVASGVKSMVLGEPEILGQVKQSIQVAKKKKTAGKVLQRLWRTAIAASGRARNETGISSGSVSFGYTVVDLARSIFRQLENCSVLLVGAGETARLVTRNLIERGVGNIAVSNRGERRAEDFHRQFPQAQVLPFTERETHLAEFDVVVATTGAEEPILTCEGLRQAIQTRRGRPLLVVDLGVPRNVEPKAEHLDSLFLQDIDSLEALIQRNLKKRRDEIPKVQDILDHELNLFSAWCRGLAAEPLVAELQRQAERIRRQALEEVRHRFPDDTHQELENLTRSLVRKILHHPSVQLRQSRQEDGLVMDVIRDLFQLDSKQEE